MKELAQQAGWSGKKLVFFRRGNFSGLNDDRKAATYLFALLLFSFGAYAETPANLIINPGLDSTNGDKLMKQSMLKEKPLPKDGIMLSASFTEKADAETAYTSGVLKLFQGEIRKNEGVDGKGALYLSEYGYAEIDNGNIYPGEGTIEFWFKPIGDPEVCSHTYLSWGWNTVRIPYCAFSQGWWEGDGGKASTVFILDNSLENGVGMPTLLSVGRWTHYAVTWNTSSNLVESIYRDGVLQLQRRSAKAPTNQVIATPIYLGADLGAALAKGRRAHGYFNYLTFHLRCLSSNEVKQSFLLHAPEDVKRDAENPRAWMSNGLNMPPREMRDKDGVLLESRMIVDEQSFYLRSKTAVDADIDRIARSGFNVVMTCVYHGFGAMYRTDKEKMSKRAIDFQNANPGYDPYAYFIERMHAKGLEVISYFTVMYQDNSKNNGKPAFPTFLANKDDSFYNGYDPRFRDLIISMMLDHAKAYAIDGVDLDFIRCQNGLDTEVAAQEYKKIFGRDLAADRSDEKRMAEFSSYCVDDIVRRTREGLDKIRPGLHLSAAVGVQLANDGLAGNGRNPRIWLEKGWVDFAYCMTYGKSPNMVRFDKARTEVKDPAVWVPLLNNYDYQPGIVPCDPKILAENIDYTRRKYNDGNGVGLYFYPYLSDEQIAALRAGPFKENAKPSLKRNTGGR